jgi:hypothetical protein
MTIDQLFSGLIGSVLGGVVTCIYSNYFAKIKLKKDIQLKAYDDVIDNIFQTKQSLSHLLTYINIYITNAKNQDEFISGSINASMDKYTDLCYEFAKNSTNLMGAIHKRQLVFVEFRDYTDGLYKILEEIAKITNELKNAIINIKKAEMNSKFNELNEISIELNKLLWNFAIDMENLFLSNVFKKRINKSIKPSKK